MMNELAYIWPSGYPPTRGLQGDKGLQGPCMNFTSICIKIKLSFRIGVYFVYFKF